MMMKTTMTMMTMMMVMMIQACIDDPRLKRIWVTRIFGDFTANVFFPKFDHKFQRVKYVLFYFNFFGPCVRVRTCV